MGKYEIESPSEIGDMEYEKLYFLKSIANELAESNRLKRMELDNIFKSWRQPPIIEDEV